MDNKDISKMSVVELKALAYDVLKTLEVTQQNLRVINAQIEKTEQAEANKAVEPTKGK